jgi:transposase
LAESCDEEAPHLITSVETTSAPVSDGAVTPVIHSALEEKALLPQTHLADTGFVDAELLVESQHQYGVNLVGPTRDKYHYEARSADRFSVSNFEIDWQSQTAICPEGKQSLSWSPIRKKSGKESIKIKFSHKDCKVCPSHEQCTKAKRIRRAISILPREQHEALQAARKRERTDEYRQEYQRRAGVEGTISQGVRGFGMRRSRYIGLAKTHLQHLLTATAMNVVRLVDWLNGKELAQTRQTPFVRLMALASG